MKTIQNNGIFSKSSVRARLIAVQVFLKKQEKNQINNLTLYLKQIAKRRNEEPQG